MKSDTRTGSRSYNNLPEMIRCLIRKSTRCASTTSKSPFRRISSIATSRVSCSSNVTLRANNTPKSISLSRVAVPSACEPKSHTPITSGLFSNNSLSLGNLLFRTLCMSRFIACVMLHLSHQPLQLPIAVFASTNPSPLQTRSPIAIPQNRRDAFRQFANRQVILLP